MSDPEELFLILHKVRGEPAWDVAIRVQIGDETGWIVPTSGHRAYPYRHWKLEDLADISDNPQPKPYDTIAYDLLKDDFGHLRDHYELERETRGRAEGTLDQLAKLIGRVQGPPLKIRRFT